MYILRQEDGSTEVWWQTHGDSRKRTRLTAIPGEERNPLLYRLSLYPYSRRRWASKDALR